MLRKLKLKDINSFVGVNEICIDEAANFTALLGRNGAGKSTILLALAFAGGIIDISWMDSSSFVEMVMSDDSTFRRNGDSKCFINDVFCSLHQYKSALASKIRMHLINFGEDWVSVMSDAKNLFDYICVLSHQASNETVSWDNEAYAEAVSLERQLALEVQKDVTKQNKITRELKVLQNALDINTKGENDLNLSYEYRAKSIALKAAVFRYKHRATEALIGKLAVQLEHNQSNILKNDAAVRKATHVLRRIKAQIRRMTSHKRQAEVELEKTLEDLRQLNIKRRLQSTDHEAIDHEVLQASQAMLNGRLSNVQLHLNVLHVEKPRTPTEVVELKVYLLNQQIDALGQFCRAVSSLGAEIDSQLSLHIEDFENQLELLARTIKSLKEAEISKLDLELTYRNKAVNLSVKCDSENSQSDHFIKDGGGSINSVCGVAESQILASIKLAYPQVLGELHEFIRPLGNASISPHKALVILQNVSRLNTEIVLVVEGFSTTIEYAQRLTHIHSRPVVFLTRNAPRWTVKRHSQNLDVKAKFPDLVPLSSLFAASKGYGAHLVDYAAQNLLIASNRRAADRVLETFPDFSELCDAEGNIYHGRRGQGLFNINVIEQKTESPVIDRADAENVPERMSNLIMSWEQLRVQEMNLIRLLDETQSMIQQLKRRKNMLTRARNGAYTEINSLKHQVASLSLDLKSSRSVPLLPITPGNVVTQEVDAFAQQLHTAAQFLYDAIMKLKKTSLNEAATSITLLQLKPLILDLEHEIEDISKIKIEISQSLSELHSIAKIYEDFIEENGSKSVELRRARLDIERETRLLQDADNISDRSAQEAEANLEDVLSQLPPALVTKFRDSAAEFASNTLEKLSFDDRQLDLRIEELEKHATKHSQLAEMRAAGLDVHTRLTAVSEGAIQATIAAGHSKSRHKLAKAQVRKIKKLRVDCVRKAIEVMNPHLRNVYRGVYSQAEEQQVQIELKLIDEEETFPGVAFYAMPINKTFAPVSSLSSGEYTVTLLAFQVAACIAFAYDLVLVDDLDALLDSAAREHIGRVLEDLLQLQSDSCKVFIATNEGELYDSANQYIGLLKIEGKTVAIVVQ